MEMPKPTDADKERFRLLVPEGPGVEIKPMFGNLGAFVNGNMFMGLFGSSVGVKLADEDRRLLLAEPGTGPFGPADRPMGSYVALPGAWGREEAEPWTARSHDQAARRPPKQKKTGRRRG